MSLISRWWRSRGHGVHSPLAYELITEVVRQQYGYYAYAERIDPVARTRRELRLGRLAHRLAVRFYGEPIAVRGDCCEAVRQGILAAGPRASVAEHARVTLYTDPRLLASAPPPAALVIEGRHAAITVERPEVPALHVKILF